MDVVTDPRSWWIDPFVDNVFMQRALVAALLAVVCTAVVGTWVVVRGLSFLGDALAHGVLPGIAVAFVIGVSTTLGAFAAAIVMVLGINLVRSHSPLPADTSIGILFVGMLSLAVVILSSSNASYVGDLNRFLFGSIVSIDDADLVRQAVTAVVAVVGVVVLHRALLVSTYDETQATLLGLRPALTQGALLVLIAASIVASFETVGNLLVFAFLVAPPATAALLVRRIPVIMATAVGLGSAAAITGLLVSFHHDTATGATMALVSVGGFMIALAGAAVRRWAGSSGVPVGRVGS